MQGKTAIRVMKVVTAKTTSFASNNNYNSYTKNNSYNSYASNNSYNSYASNIAITVMKVITPKTIKYIYLFCK